MAERQIVPLKIGSYSESSLATIECLTLLHVGAGRGFAGSPIDLPIQKDAFGFPMISGSSLKGPIRQLFKRNKKKDEDSEVFGKDSLDGDELEEEYYAGAVMVLDARLLSIPVRSLKGIYVEATCPYMLSNFATYAEARNGTEFHEIRALLRSLEAELQEERRAAMTQETFKQTSIQLKSGPTIILGDDGEYKAIPSEIIQKIAALLRLEQKKLVVCRDDDMHDHILKRAIIVTQRIKIDEEKKTVSPGALWSEENLPQMTRLVTALFYSKSRKPKIEKSALEIKNSIQEVLAKSSAMILGGDETVGRGLCKINLW